MKRRRTSTLLAVLLLLAAVAGRAGAQELLVEGRVDHPAMRVLSEVLARGDYRLVDRDTVLPADFRATGDLLIVAAEVRLEGSVDGSVAVVHGALFTRPGSRIAGEVAALGGELYLTRRGETGAVHELPPVVQTRFLPEAGGYRLVILAPAPPPRLGLDGISGMGIPTYDRVNGLTARVGGRFLLRRDTVAPLVRGSVTYASVRRAVGGTLALDVPVAGGWLTGELARESMTNEAWIRGPLMNTLSALVVGSDLRDYHESDVALLRWERRPRQPLIQGESFFGPRLSVRASRDRSLEAASVWSLLGGDDWRENPPIDDGTVVSVTPGAALDWRGSGLRFIGDVAVEWAPGAGDFEFTHLIADGRWTMPALWGHAVSIRGRTHQTLGNDPAPRQRWSFIGGPGTIPTLDTAAMRGDRLAFVDTRYDVPLRWIRIPVLGSPDLRVQHSIGAAWRTGEPMPPWEQSLGAGLRFFLVEAMMHVDPAAGALRPVVSIGTGFEL